jgi:RNA polymerase sigma-70 factor, ECF subfamily
MSTVCVTDAELVALARQGDQQAFGELVTRHQAAVYRAALAAVGSAAEAEDAAQEAFISAYRRLGSFRGDASFKTWLLTIAWNHAINRRRRITRWFSGQAGRAWLSGQETETRSVMLADGRPSPEQAAMDAQLRRDIAAEIRALSPKLRDALLLAQSGEYGYGEIAAMLGTKIGTVKWRVSEARRVIKMRLRERGYADVG